MSPLAWFAGAFAVGIVGQRTAGFSILVLAASTVMLLLAASVFRSAQRSSILVLFLISSVGALSFWLETNGIADTRLRRMLEDHRISSGDPVEIEGTVEGGTEPAPNGFYLTLRSSLLTIEQKQISATGRVRVFAISTNGDTRQEYEELDLQHGTRLRLVCRIKREDSFRNPGVSSRRELLDRQGIDATCSVKSPLLLENLGRDRVFIVAAWVYALRARLIFEFDRAFSASTSGVLIATLLGDKHFLERSTAEIFRLGGTFHVLVISGLHITFIGFFALWLLRMFTARRSIQAVLTLAFLWLYAMAVGGDAPVIRACVMFTVFLVGYATFRQTTMLNTFGASVLLLLVWRPSDLFDPSFQLTAVSVGSIVLFAVPMISKLRAIGKWMPSPAEPFPPNVPTWLRRACETLYWRDELWQIESRRQIWYANISKTPFLRWPEKLGLRRTLAFVFESMVVSLSVSIWLLPLMIWYFHRITPASILLNIWVGAVLAIESFAAIASIALLQIGEVFAIPFITVTEVANRFLIDLQSISVGISQANWRVPIYSGPTRALYLLYFAPVAAVAIAISRWNPFSLVRQKSLFGSGLTGITAIVVIAAVLVRHPFSAPATDGRLQVEFIDVGQGDAAFITFPDGQTMLVDGGGRVSYADDDAFEADIPRIGEMVVSEFLWERGYSSIDSIVATHPDADHIQGLADVARNFNVGLAYFGRINGDDADERELLEVLRQRNVPIHQIAAGDVLRHGGVQIDVLNPPRNAVGTSPNNDSVVLRLVFGKTAVLLTGDVEREAEERIQHLDLQSDIVKVPHHGSRSSSTDGFVRGVRPRFAVISVPRRSLFGHPHPDVVARWRDSGAQIITTGESGLVSITSDGNDVLLRRHAE